MGNLLKLELRGIFTHSSCKMAMPLCILTGVLIGVLNHVSDAPVCSDIFSWTAIVLIMLSALGGLYISREFTQNTIRNKIVVGHGREMIYLSKLVAVTVIYLVCIGLLVLTMITMGLVLSGNDEINREAVLKGLMVTVSCTVACAAITTAISMTLKTDLGALIPLLLFFLTMTFSGLGYEFIDKEIMDKVNLLLPIGPMMQLNTAAPMSNYLACIVCPVLEACVISVAGYISFQKADLN